MALTNCIYCVFNPNRLNKHVNMVYCSTYFHSMPFSQTALKATQDRLSRISRKQLAAFCVGPSVGGMISGIGLSVGLSVTRCTRSMSCPPSFGHPLPRPISSKWSVLKRVQTITLKNYCPWQSFITQQRQSAFSKRINNASILLFSCTISRQMKSEENKVKQQCLHDYLRL